MTSYLHIWRFAAVLVYRLVCQPVTLESWVRFPDAAAFGHHTRTRVSLTFVGSPFYFTSFRGADSSRTDFWPDDYGRGSRCRPSSMRTLCWPYRGQQPGGVRMIKTRNVGGPTPTHIRDKNSVLPSLSPALN